MKNKNKIILTIIVALVVVGLAFLIPKNSGEYEDFAKFLAKKEVKIYGAFWCSHCQAQRNMFNSGKKYLSYVECSTSDARDQLQVCKDALIESYPTWVLPIEVFIISDNQPIVCEIDSQKEECVNLNSQYFKTWYFPGYTFLIKNKEDPIKDGNLWKFKPGSHLSGEIPIEFLTAQMNYELHSDTK